uniref:DNA-directed DNA polymerase n=1 Tax=Trichogramma kaykai TaxID=54128 RepID=A0ABD2WXG3_9HYME
MMRLREKLSIYAELDKGIILTNLEKEVNHCELISIFHTIRPHIISAICKLEEDDIGSLGEDEVFRRICFGHNISMEVKGLYEIFIKKGVSKLLIQIDSLLDRLTSVRKELLNQLKTIQEKYGTNINKAKRNDNQASVKLKNSNVNDHIAVAGPSKMKGDCNKFAIVKKNEMDKFNIKNKMGSKINDCSKNKKNKKIKMDFANEKSMIANDGITIDKPIVKMISKIEGRDENQEKKFRDDVIAAIKAEVRGFAAQVDALEVVRKSNNDLSPEEIQRYATNASNIISGLASISRGGELFAKDHHLWVKHLQKRIKNIYLFLQNKLGDHVGAGISNEEEERQLEWTESERLFDGAIRTGFIENHSHTDVRLFLKDCLPIFQTLILSILAEHPIKTYCSLLIEFKTAKISDDGDTHVTKWLTTTALPILHDSEDIENWFEENVINDIEMRIDRFTENGSGWAINQIICFSSTIMKYDPVKGSSYIDLSRFIKNKVACCNVQNLDNRCFEYSILARKYWMTDRAHDPNKYKQYLGELNMDGLEQPMSIKDIKKFEKMNPTISVNVYMLKKKRDIFNIYPVCLTNEEKQYHTNLLLIESEYKDECDDDDNNDDRDYGGTSANCVDNGATVAAAASNADQTNSEAEVLNQGEHPTSENQNLPISPNVRQHYVLIRSMSRLCRSQLTRSKNMIHICNRCLVYFSKKILLEKHKVNCRKFNDCCSVSLPQEGETLEFSHHRFQLKLPFVIYADFETILAPNKNKCEFDRTTHYHNAFSIGYYVKCSFDDSKSYYKSYRQTNANDITPAAWFVKELAAVACDLEKLITDVKEMIISEEQEAEFQKAERCHICNKCFDNNNDKQKPVRDHCHFTGLYRGPAHNNCNLNYKDSKQIPVFFHNLSNYDAHIFIKELCGQVKGRVQVLAQSKEKYISFTKHIDNTKISFRFLDSLKFLSGSLQKIAETLDSKPILERVFATEDGFNKTQIEKLTEKGVFPYEYIDCIEKLEEQELSPIGAFYSSLSNDTIEQKDYERAQTVWNLFQIKNIGEYSDLYLKTDVLLLSDIFENFRKSCMEYYGLDPSHYYTTPGFTWSAMLKHTGVKLELLSDIDMVLFIEKAIRGGLCQVSNRFARANNPYMGTDFNPEEPTSYLMYYDVNNLYGHAMSQSLPTGGFEWVTEEIEVEGESETEMADSEVEWEMHRNEINRVKKKKRVKKAEITDSEPQMQGNEINRRLAQIQDINRIEEGQQQNQNIKMASNVEGVQQNQDMEMEGIEEEQNAVTMIVVGVNQSSNSRKRPNLETTNDATSIPPSKKMKHCGGVQAANRTPVDALKADANSNGIISSSSGSSSNTSITTIGDYSFTSQQS